MNNKFLRTSLLIILSVTCIGASSNNLGQSGIILLRAASSHGHKDGGQGQGNGGQTSSGGNTTSGSNHNKDKHGEEHPVGWKVCNPCRH